MKKLFGLVLILLMLILPVSADTVRAPRGFAGRLWNSTLALYGTLGSVTHFLCTAEPIAKIDGGYRLLTAGHCVQESPASLEFSVAENIEGPRTPVTLVKAHEGTTGADDVDFALFDVKTSKKYQVFELGDDNMQIGERTINPHFAMALGKQLSYGVVSSGEIVKSENCDDNGCLNNFLDQEYAGPGASGSAVLSLRTHKVLGILVYQLDAPIGFAVEPISRLPKFLAMPTQPHPAEAAKRDDPSIRIPEAVYQANFGSAHPFTLTVRGPNPRFTQSDYTFVVNLDGMELSDDYYYNVPVFIDENEDGTYNLVSTKEGYSVGLVVVQGPKQ